MSRQSDAETSFKAQKALSAIHEAREDADDALDDLMKAHHRGTKKAEAEQLFHVAVMKLYNRLRPYLGSVPRLALQYELHVETDENGEAITETVTTEDGKEVERPMGIFGLRSLDDWRMLSISRSKEVERFGKENNTQVSEEPARLPPEIAISAYDGLQEAIVRLNFGAEPGEDVMKTHLDDAPDSVKETKKDLPDEWKNSKGSGATADD